jgi:hypothetical protein
MTRHIAWNFLLNWHYFHCINSLILIIIRSIAEGVGGNWYSFYSMAFYLAHLDKLLVDQHVYGSYVNLVDISDALGTCRMTGATHMGFYAAT